MHRRIIPVALLTTLTLVAGATSAFAQADAQAAYEGAKKAYEAGNFEQARDLAQKAAETDNKNPEVFILLGKAHYQLGELDEAIQAWRRTIRLVPAQPYAKRMLEALRATAVDVDTRIKLVETLIQQRLAPQAQALCTELLRDKAVTDAQRARILLLQAEAALETGSAPTARKTVELVRALYPGQFDPVQAMLLEGQAKLRQGGELLVPGVKLLEKVVAEHADAAAAKTAAFELAAHALRQGVTADRVTALAKWLADNPDHRQAGAARTLVIDACLGMTTKAGKPEPDAPLSEWDTRALELTTAWVATPVPAAEIKGLVQKLLGHLQSHYAGNEAFAAAVKGIETLLAAPLPADSRRLALGSLASTKAQVATHWLEEQARAGALPESVAGAALPKPLAEVVAVYDTINQQYPAEPAWADQVALAERVRGYSGKVLATKEITALNGPDTWTVAIAMPVVKAGVNKEAVGKAVTLLHALIAPYAGQNEAAAKQAALAVSRQLVQAVSPEEGPWAAVIEQHAALLDNYAQFVFNENVKAGKPELNAQLSDIQKELLGTLSQLVTGNVNQADAALKRLGEHLKPWVEQGQWAVAEQAYTTLAGAMPESKKRAVDLSVIHLWLAQVNREAQRLAQAGLSVPPKLDPTLAKVLKRCYAMQANLDEGAAGLDEIRGLWYQAVNFYKTREYFDVARQAIELKADPANETADAYAQLQLAILEDELARRDLDQFLKQYNAKEKIALTPAFKKAIAAYQKFITDRAANPLASRAVEGVFAIGSLFESHAAYQVATSVYSDFAKFAAGVNVLSQAGPDKASTAERAEFAAAGALDAQARKVLDKQLADRPEDAPPPAKLSAEFTAAVSAYRDFIKAHPDSPLLSAALEKIMAVALRYAQIDAWDVAEAIYADLLASDLKIRRPERLVFCRGLCKLGPAMPDHARQMLQTLTQGGLPGPGGGESLSMLAGVMGGPEGTGRPGADTGAGGQRMGPTTAASTPNASARTPLTPPNAPASGLPQPPAARPPGERAEADRDAQLLAMIRTQETNRAAQVAQLREDLTFNAYAAQPAANQAAQQGQVPQQAEQQAPVQQRVQQIPRAPVLSEAELARQEKAIQAAYDVFQSIRKDYPETVTAEQARGEILIMVGHWRGLRKWNRAADLAAKYLGDNPRDGELPKLRLETARDRLAYAAEPIKDRASKQEMLAEVAKRFQQAREALAAVVKDFPDEKSYRQQAQWDVATSFLTQARAVAAFSPTLAQGQYVRAASELQQVAEQYPRHPNIATIPQRLWEISQELEARRYYDQAIRVWNELAIHYPVNALAQQAALKVAQTYHQNLKLPLRAAEAYLEVNFARGGSDQGLQNAIFQIGTNLKNEKRWVESLHVLELFVDSFPQNPQAGQALTMVGQIHQTNEAWTDAIKAYRRVIDDFENGQWVQDAKWSIAECTINLSQWGEAMDAYREYVKAYPKDAKVAEANRRIEVLKELARYQSLVDEEGQRKAFDAQFQIARIVQTELSNPVKAIIEYRKVTENWPQSHLADDALYAAGEAYLGLEEKKKAREALLAVADKYPNSPLADDALFLVGKSYEDEAQKLAEVDWQKTLERNKDIAQRRAYEQVQENRRLNVAGRGQRIAQLKQAGKAKGAEAEEAAAAVNYGQFDVANVTLFAQQAAQEVETLTAMQLADRQDKIDAARRKAVEAYQRASEVAGADKADDALLRMATIYDQQLKDSKKAMQTWLEIVRQFSGSSVAEDASWRIAQHYERQRKWDETIDAYKAFLRNYPGSANAGPAQFAIAEAYEHLDKWVEAMDAYTNYINRFPQGPLVKKAQDQINWIKTYRL